MKHDFVARFVNLRESLKAEKAHIEWRLRRIIEAVAAFPYGPYYEPKP